MDDFTHILAQIKTAHSRLDYELVEKLKEDLFKKGITANWEKDGRVTWVSSSGESGEYI